MHTIKSHQSHSISTGKKNCKVSKQNPASTVRNFQSTTYFVLISKVQVQVSQKKLHINVTNNMEKKIITHTY